MKRSKLNTDIIFPDGTKATTNLDELFECADIFAHHYGIGGCKTFSEFVSMIDQEDPVVLYMLQKAMIQRVQVQNGKRKTFHKQDDSNVGYKNKEVKVGWEQNELVSMLKTYGASRDDINDALARIKSGQIQLPKHDFSWITPEVLADPNFDFQKTLKEMQEDYNNSVKVKVDFESLERRKREVDG